MSPTDLAVQEQQSAKTSPGCQRLQHQVATVNGSGSQTANLVLLRSILSMGVPVSGKTCSPQYRRPSDVSTIRASKRGYNAEERIDFLVAMNPGRPRKTC
jgi:2-oxoglutarate ferredoxin oxidoreductase subunit alpha